LPLAEAPESPVSADSAEIATILIFAALQRHRR